MADIADVEQAVADNVSGILYPNGISNGSIIGATCRIYRGWPNAATLNADLAAGVVNLTITSDNESGRVSTRYMDEGQISLTKPSLSIEVSANTISLTGTPGPAMLVGALIDGVPFVYRTDGSETAFQVAAGLGERIRVSRPAALAGATLAIPGAYTIVARVVADGDWHHETRRQEKDLRVVFWCPSPGVRDSVAGAVDLALSQRTFLGLDDGSSARIGYRNTAEYDQSQNALLYRRDIVYCVEYPTIVTASVPAMLFGGAGINCRTTFG